MGNRILTLNIDEGYHNRNIINSVISDEGKKVTSEANGNHFRHYGTSVNQTAYSGISNF
jgi:hypothetical protein